MSRELELRKMDQALHLRAMTLRIVENLVNAFQTPFSPTLYEDFWNPPNDSSRISFVGGSDARLSVTLGGVGSPMGGGVRVDCHLFSRWVGTAAYTPTHLKDVVEMVQSYLYELWVTARRLQSKDWDWDWDSPDIIGVRQTVDQTLERQDLYLDVVKAIATFLPPSLEMKIHPREVHFDNPKLNISIEVNWGSDNITIDRHFGTLGKLRKAGLAMGTMSRTVKRTEDIPKAVQMVLGWVKSVGSSPGRPE